MIFNPERREWGIMERYSQYEIEDPGTPESERSRTDEDIAYEHSRRVYGDRRMLSAADTSLFSSALYTQTIGMKRYVRSMDVGEMEVLEPLTSSEVSTKGLTLLWKAGGGARSGEFELNREAMLKLMNDKRAVVGKGLAWTSRALRQQSRTQRDASHYSAEIVWHKGETAFDSAQQQVVPIVKGKIPGTSVGDDVEMSDTDQSSGPAPSTTVILEGAAIPKKDSFVVLSPTGTPVADVATDYDATIPDWDDPRDFDDVLPVVTTEQFIEGTAAKGGADMALHTDSEKWRPTLEGSDPRQIVREKINRNKINPRGPVTKRGATDHAPQSSAASSSGAQPPQKSPRQ